MEVIQVRREEKAAAAIDLAGRLAVARVHAHAGLLAGQGGVELASCLTLEVEAGLCSLLDFCLGRAGLGSDGSGLAVLATGGFGRREFAPFSDLDLLFLHEDRLDHAKLEQIVVPILGALADAHLDAGHAVRSVDEALELPAGDLTAATALLDVRFLRGDAGLGERFSHLFRTRLAGKSPGAFVARLRAEQRARHSRFGDTIFLLEPDLKSGPGGFRDLCAGRWAAATRFGTGDPGALGERGEMSARQVSSIEAARDWLLRVRIGLHLQAGRKQDHLRFEFQEQLGPMLYPHVRPPPAGDGRPAVAPAVEALMHDFQLHAKAISRETERLIARASAEPGRVPKVQSLKQAGEGFLGRAVDGSFELRDGVLEVKDASIFEREPSEMVRVFVVATNRDLPVGLHTKDLIAELAVGRAEALRADPTSARLFWDVLCAAEDQAKPSRLEQMNDLGVIEALIPEWGPIVGRVQHDVYHVYTVDQHALYGVALLKALIRGDHLGQHPRPSEAARQLDNARVLYFATLLHDVGKGLGRNHSVQGAEVARVVATRLGMSPDEVKRVELLVRHHLVMSHVSQRRDLGDLSQIGQIARIVGTSEEALRELFVLTFCDQYCIGPGNLSAWKGELLDDLFRRALTFIRRGPDLLVAERVTLVQQRRAEAAGTLGDAVPAAALQRLFSSLPDRYFLENRGDRVAEHVRIMRGRTSACAVQITHRADQGFSELCLVADDVPGLLAVAAGVLFANRINILDAAIYSADPIDDASRGQALDVFLIQRAGGGPVTDAARIEAVRRDLAAVLGGLTTVEALLAARPAAAPSLLDAGKPQVPDTEAKVDNEVSSDFTIIDVYTQDRPGVLYDIARVLHQQGLDIHRSKVATEADRAADIFYVRDEKSGEKITDAERLYRLCRALCAALPTRA